MKTIARLQLKDVIILIVILLCIGASAFFYLKGDMFVEKEVDKEYEAVNESYNDGKTVITRFRDEDGNFVEHKNGYFYCLVEWSDDRKTSKVTYFGQDDNVKMTNFGYAIIERNHDDKGRITRSVFYDTDNNPVKRELGEFGYITEYDSNNRPIKEIFINEQYQIMNGTRGYAIIERTFNDDGSISRSMYFDKDGNPARLVNGAYGVSYENGKTIYLNKNGKWLFCIENIITNSQAVVVVFGILLCAILFASRNKKVIIAIFLFIYILFVLYVTLNRQQIDSNALRPFSSYKQFFTSCGTRRQILNNIWLFVPIGVATGLLSAQKRFLVLPILFSVVIEIVQLITRLGFFEVDDMVSNTIGTIIGCLMAYVFKTITKRPEMVSQSNVVIKGMDEE